MIVAAQIIGGLAMLFFGGESLVRGAVKIAKKFNMSTLLIGITVVAYGTSSPELLITLQSVMNDHHEIAYGNVLGSNIANILLVLGLSAFICPIIMKDEKIINFDILYMILSVVALIIVASLGQITRVEGTLLVFILITYTVATFKRSQNHHDVLEQQVEEVEGQLHYQISLPIAILLVFAGIFLLTFGADFLVTGATTIAEDYDVPQAVIAVTIVAIGGSAPEIATSVIAATRKHSDIALGNVIGSNLFNILGVLGITSIVKPIITYSPTLSVFDIWVVLFASILLFILTKAKKQISRRSACFFLICYFFYIIWQVSLIN